MDYKKLGAYAEYLMKDVVRGNIETSEYIQLINEKILELREVSEKAEHSK